MKKENFPRRKKGYTVKFSEAVYNELARRGVTEDTLKRLAQAVINVPKKDGLAVDTSDNMIKVGQYPISFIRDHRHREIEIITNEEALQADIAAGDAKIKYARQFVEALKKRGAADTDNLEIID